MREILFKAKRKDNGEWVEGSLIFIDKSPVTFIGYAVDNGYCYGMDIHEVYPETVCQYTGLKDKIGKKIWENDFIKFSSRVDKELIWQGKVVYENCQFVVCELCDGVYDGYSVIPLSRVSTRNLEVIGNIYDGGERK